MTSYAKGTNVSVEKSRAELDTLLKKHGATSRLIGVDDEHHRAIVGFALGGARFRLNIPLADPARIENGWRPYAGLVRACRKCAARAASWLGPNSLSKDALCTGCVPKHARSPRELEQATRERWRLVILLLKAKLEAIALGLSTANREFLADMIVDQDDRTMEELLNAGGMSRLLLLGPGPAPTTEKRP